MSGDVSRKYPRVMRTGWVAGVSLLLLIMSGTAHGQGLIAIQNSFSEPLELWIWVKDAKKPKNGRWLPKLYLTAGGKGEVRVPETGSLFLIGRDLAKNDDSLGYADLNGILRIDPRAAYLIRGQYITKQVSYEYQVMVPKTEQRTASRQLCEYVEEVLPNGQRILRPTCRSVEYNYTVQVPTYESRTATKSVVKLDLTGEIVSGGQQYSLEEFLGNGDPAEEPAS